MSAGAYLMIKFNDREKLIPAVEKINQLETVAKWDAVDGHYNLVLKTNNYNDDFIKKIKSIDGLADWVSCQIEQDNDPSDKFDSEYSYAYIFIDAQQDKVGEIASQLTKFDKVQYCSLTSGACNIVVLLKAETFDLIDRLIENEIKPLDGLLRLKQERVLLLESM